MNISLPPCSAPGCTETHAPYQDVKIDIIPGTFRVATTVLAHYCLHHWRTRHEMRSLATQLAVDWMKADPAFLDEVIAKRRELDRSIKGK